MVSIRWRPSLQWLPSASGAAHVDRCHSTRSRSRLEPTWPPVRTTARQKTRGAAGAASSGFEVVGDRSLPLLGVDSMVVAAMVVDRTSLLQNRTHPTTANLLPGPKPPPR